MMVMIMIPLFMAAGPTGQSGVKMIMMIMMIHSFSDAFNEKMAMDLHLAPPLGPVPRFPLLFRFLSTVYFHVSLIHPPPPPPPLPTSFLFFLPFGVRRCPGK